MGTTTKLHPDRLTVLAQDEDGHLHALDHPGTFRSADSRQVATTTRLVSVLMRGATDPFAYPLRPVISLLRHQRNSSNEADPLDRVHV